MMAAGTALGAVHSEGAGLAIGTYFLTNGEPPAALASMGGPRARFGLE
jgi:hypothetical protein